MTTYGVEYDAGHRNWQPHPTDIPPATEEAAKRLAASLVENRTYGGTRAVRFPVPVEAPAPQAEAAFAPDETGDVLDWLASLDRQNLRHADVLDISYAECDTAAHTYGSELTA